MVITVNPRPSVPSVWLKLRILDEKEEGSKDKKEKKMWQTMAEDSIVEELKCCPTKSGFSPVGDGNLLKNFNPEQNS